jgi:UDP-GlcNAc:undecaprenyl-phosphate GlcNAc-1-phosphate transferase
VNGLNLAVLAFMGAVTCALLVPFAKRLATRLSAIDRPDPRRINSVPIPRMGGVAIFLSFLTTLMIAFFVAQRLGRSTAFNPRGAIAFGLGVIIVFVTGVIDDVKGLRPRTKLLCELLAASLVVAIGGCQARFVSTPWGPWDLGLAALPLTILWVVGVTNAINLLDGMDGLASGVSAIALSTILILVGSDHASAILAAILIGCCLGFLVHNFHPATIFMGDSGSLVLGMSLGVLSTYANVKGSTSLVIAIPLLVVALPLTDILLAMGRRYLRGLAPGSARSHFAAFARMFVPDRNHLHHKLLDAGFGQRQAAFILLGAQGAAGIVAIYLAVLSASSSKPSARDATAVVVSTSVVRVDLK